MDRGAPPFPLFHSPLKGSVQPPQNSSVHHQSGNEPGQRFLRDKHSCGPEGGKNRHQELPRPRQEMKREGSEHQHSRSLDQGQPLHLVGGKKPPTTRPASELPSSKAASRPSL